MPAAGWPSRGAASAVTEADQVALTGPGNERAGRGIHRLRLGVVLGAVLLTLAPTAEQRPATGSSRSDTEQPPPYVTAAVTTLRARSHDTSTAATGGESTRPAPPTAISIPSLAVRAPVVGVRMDASGGLTPPSDPQVLGWWSQGAPVGSLRGSTLVTGHTVHTGGGALDDLEDLKVGAQVRARTDGGVQDYVVSAVRTYSKGRLARRAAQLFSQSVPHRLVLVTCEDWNGTAYESNVVVVAQPV